MAGSDDSERRWYVYLVETAGGALYTGVTTDVTRRVEQHARGRGARALRGKGPLTLRHAEYVGAHGDALRLEASIKRLSAAAKRRWLTGRHEQAPSEQAAGERCHRNVIIPGQADG
ncbi:GIY-YIG nuclease family protein [Salinicola halophilus]|uniref:GIY-YIG nuclease family protein n=1 Tax=Salinicola halophilus TaxID=184065 RepID=UPI000DA19C06|nr:GIY-YIG nuclease family protein [Salinicola halophilus]